jgi:hypothetical protein
MRTPWNRTLLENLTVAQLITKCHTFYELEELYRVDKSPAMDLIRIPGRYTLIMKLVLNVVNIQE